MRVVAGELRGRRIAAPEGTSTRPTTDRVREAVFNSLGSMDLLVDAVVIDLFAGTGALGIEALSRGAARCTFVERDPVALRVLRQNLAELDLRDRSTVVPADALGAARSLPPADLVFADPPYEFDQWADLLGAIDVPFAVVETGGPLRAPSGWSVLREKRYGRTYVAFLRRDEQVP